MFEYCIFPEGKTNIVTFTYDDGRKNDKRLIELFDKYKVKGTFNLIGSHYEGMSDRELAEVGELYKNHEVACHTYQHGWTGFIPPASVVSETMQDRRMLEKITGRPVLGLAYPYGSHNPQTIEAIRACGILYARAAKFTNSFQLPVDFMSWNPTCHHKDAMGLVDLFLASVQRPKGTTHISGFRPLFSILGHSYEFRTEEDWTYMETLVQKLAGYENVWYATSMEIYEYMQAQKQLRISADEKIIVNPTTTDVWLIKDRNTVLCIKAGETLILE